MNLVTPKADRIILR